MMPWNPFTRTVTRGQSSSSSQPFEKLIQWAGNRMQGYEKLIRAPENLIPGNSYDPRTNLASLERLVQGLVRGSRLLVGMGNRGHSIAGIAWDRGGGVAVGEKSGGCLK